MLHRGLFRAIAPSATNIRFKSSRVDVPPIWEEIPLIGLGTAAFEDTGSSLVQAVECALVAGVRLFDTAQNYGSEAGLGTDFTDPDLDLTPCICRGRPR